MTLKEQRRVARRDERVKELKQYCKTKLGKSYSVEEFNLIYTGYELCRRRVMKGVEL